MKAILYPCLALCLLIGVEAATAQSNDKSNEHPMTGVYLGLGLGLEYGGIGLKVEYLPITHLGLFLGMGYNLADLGVNAGLSYKIIAHAKVTPIINVMYGFNTVVDTGFYYGTGSIAYYGLSFGAGVDIRTGKASNKFSLSILYPVRSSQYKDRMNGSNSSNPAIAASIGFNFSLRPKEDKKLSTQ
jgi:hypothetical protein